MAAWILVLLFSATGLAQFNGDGTYYGPGEQLIESGACQLSGTESDAMGSMVTAINTQQWNNSYSCGACSLVTGESGSVTVKIVDQGPPNVGDLDLSTEAFTLVAPIAKGRVPISWNFVACPLTGPILYLIASGANPWWVSLQVRNGVLPIVAVELFQQAKWIGLSITNNYWSGSVGGGLVTPCQIRVTATSGQQLYDTISQLVPGQTITGSANFNPDMDLL